MFDLSLLNHKLKTYGVQSVQVLGVTIQIRIRSFTVINKYAPLLRFEELCEIYETNIKYILRSNLEYHHLELPNRQAQIHLPKLTGFSPKKKGRAGLKIPSSQKNGCPTKHEMPHLVQIF